MIFSRARGLTAAVAWLRMLSRAASSHAIISGFVEPSELVLVVRQHHSQPVQRNLGVRDRSAERVPGVIVGVGGLDVRDERRAEHRLAGAHGLQGDAVGGEHRRSHRRGPNPLRCSRCRAPNPAICSDPSVEHHTARFDRLDVSHPHHVVDPSQLLEFGLRHDRAAVHLRFDRLVDAQQGSGVREPGEEVVDRFGLLRPTSAGRRRRPAPAWRTADRVGCWRGSAARHRGA